MEIDLASDLVRITGYDLAGHWLSARIAEHLGRARSADARRLDYENIAIQALPTTLEPLGLEPLEEPLPPSSATLAAMHLLGLFHSPLFGPTLGGLVRGRSYAFDLNLPASPVYAASYNDDGPLGLEGYVALDDGRPGAIEALRLRWMAVQEKEISEPSGAEKAAAAATFFREHPGLTRSQDLAKRSGVAAPDGLEPRPVPPALRKALEAGRAIAPFLLEAHGLPPRGSAPAVGREALEATGAPPELPEHEEPLARISAIAAWLAGDDAVIDGTRERLRAGARQPLSQRWLDRLAA